MSTVRAQSVQGVLLMDKRHEFGTLAEEEEMAEHVEDWLLVG
jgi:hypothetical protein